jgi:hypothetical protein
MSVDIEDFSRNITNAELAKLAEDPTLIFYAGMINRPGVSLFGVMLEYIYSPPQTDANNKFQLFLINWQRLIWAVYSIPKDEFKNAEFVSEKTGLRIANGVPTMLHDGKVDQFPMNAKSVFGLENKPGSLIYDPHFNKEKLHHIESSLIEQIVSKTINPREVDFLAAIKKSQQ